MVALAGLGPGTDHALVPAGEAAVFGTHPGQSFLGIVDKIQLAAHVEVPRGHPEEHLPVIDPVGPGKAEAAFLQVQRCPLEAVHHPFFFHAGFSSRFGGRLAALVRRLVVRAVFLGNFSCGSALPGGEQTPRQLGRLAARRGGTRLLVVWVGMLTAGQQGSRAQGETSLAFGPGGFGRLRTAGPHYHSWSVK